MPRYLPPGMTSILPPYIFQCNPRSFSLPDVFWPERWLNEDGSLRSEMRDAELAAFGFGRRICPGRHLAAASIWIGIASVLSAFDLVKPRDANGHIIEPSGDYLSGLVT